LTRTTFDGSMRLVRPILAFLFAQAAIGCGSSSPVATVTVPPHGAAQASSPASSPAPDEPAPRISCGFGLTCAIHRKRLACWGNVTGLFDSDDPDRLALAPLERTGIAPLVDIAVGIRHVCAIDEGHRLLCWGVNKGGELGDGTKVRGRFTPAPVVDDTGAPLEGVVAVDTELYHGCAVTQDGSVHCWGTDDEGQCSGDGKRAKYILDKLLRHAVRVEGVTGAIAVATGHQFTCALARVAGRGQVRCWGDSYGGQLGSGDRRPEEIARPSPVPIDADIVAVSAGEHHACALDAAGGVWCWGEGFYGELGVDRQTVGTELSSYMPLRARVLGGRAARAVSAGHGFTCALLVDGTVRCFGSNRTGALGAGPDAPDDTSKVSEAPEVVGLKDVVAIDAGALHACAVTRAGAILCWGRNERGELGNGQQAPKSDSPVAAALPF
jgi:alpha-tubulin suppressor-like RCC1 family protein